MVRNSSKLELFIVVSAGGLVRQRKRTPMVFLTQRGAERACKTAGDAVVVMLADLGKPPLYIHQMTLDPDGRPV